jgi:hypothetical protein
MAIILEELLLVSWNISASGERWTMGNKIPDQVVHRISIPSIRCCSGKS